MINSGHKTAAAFDESDEFNDGVFLPFFCIDLPVPSRLHHVCQGGYVLSNDIDFDRAKRKIFRNCVDKIRGQGKP